MLCYKLGKLDFPSIGELGTISICVAALSIILRTQKQHLYQLNMHDRDRLKLALFFPPIAIRLPTVSTIRGGLVNLVVKVDSFPYGELRYRCILGRIYGKHK